MPHIVTPEAEELLDQEFKVLDHGFVRLVDYMGGDQRIVDAARVSYQAGTKKLNSDRGLIRYLLSHKHTTPLEKVRFEFHIKLPIFVMRQLIRHRMSSVNEESARYSVMKEEFYFPKDWRMQSTTNKQGSCEAVDSDLDFEVNQQLNESCERAYTLYDEWIEKGIARELARMVLPVNLYTQFYWTIDLHNLMHFLKLRLDSHAQLEIQEFAKPIEMLARAVCPIAMEAWTDYVNDARNFSRMEIGVLQSMLATTNVETLEYIAKCSGLEPRDSKGEYTREYKEFLNKIGVDGTTKEA